MTIIPATRNRLERGLRSAPMVDLGLTDEQGLGDCLLHATHHKLDTPCWVHAFEWLIRSRKTMNLSPVGRMEHYRLEYESRALSVTMREAGWP